MSLILQIETATTCCSVALAKDGKILRVKEVNVRNAHAEVITKFIEELMFTKGLQYSKLDAIAVSCGPGSYTGLRIGISTAKGLCFALDKPLIAIDTLTAMCYGAKNLMGVGYDKSLLLCPMIDARRMEVYTALFDINIKTIKPTAAEIIDEHSFNELIGKQPILFFGDGAEKCRTVFNKNLEAKFLPDFLNSASHLTELAYQKYIHQEFEDVALFEPYYLKDFIAGKKAV